MSKEIAEEKAWEPTVDDIQKFSYPYSNFTDVGGAPVVGVCCERDSSGYTTMIYSSDDPPTRITSYKDVTTWLTKKDGRIVFCADKCFLDSLVKWYGGKAMTHFGYRTALGYDFSIDGARLSSSSGGCFTVKRGNRVVKRVYNITPFYHMSYMLPDVMQASGVKFFAEQLVKAIRDNNIPVTNLKSTGGLVSGYMSYINWELPPKEVLTIALNCYHTNWITTYALGKVDQAYDYDISSAFPYQASRLVSCSAKYGKWVQSNKFQQSSSMGFVVAEVEVGSNISPIMYRFVSSWDGFVRKAAYRNGIGNWVGYLTKPELELIKESGGHYSIIEGWWFIPRTYVYPLERTMSYLFNMRARAANEGDLFLKNLCKIISVAAPGKYISTFLLKGLLTTGTFWAPPYAAHIVAETRCALARFCLAYEDSVMATMVDGVIMNKKVPPLGSGPGAIRLSSSADGEPCVIAGDGEYWMPSRKSTFSPEVLLQYANQTGYPRLSKVGLHNRHAHNWEDVGKPLQVDILSLEALASRESQRVFYERPRKCSDLLNHLYDASRPRTIGIRTYAS